MKTHERIHAEYLEAGGSESLAEDLLSVSADVELDMNGPDCDEPYIDVRLRYHDGSFSLLTGDSSYDQDHRGFWGCSVVGADLTTDEARSVADDLIEQVEDEAAQCSV